MTFFWVYLMQRMQCMLRIGLQQNLIEMIVLLHLKVLQILPTRKCHKFYQNCVSSGRRLMKETNDFQAPAKELRTYFIKNLHEP